MSDRLAATVFSLRFGRRQLDPSSISTEVPGLDQSEFLDPAARLPAEFQDIPKGSILYLCEQGVEFGLSQRLFSSCGGWFLYIGDGGNGDMSYLSGPEEDSLHSRDRPPPVHGPPGGL